MRVGLAGAAEPDGRIVMETVCCRIEMRMLSGENRERFETALSKSGRDRCEFYGFGTGADDETYATGQPSP